MSLFGKNKEGGTLAAIRSPEMDYLVWKWRPSDAPAGKTMRENSIRWGSSLRVRDGEVAVFVYTNKATGEQQDFIEGPFDQVLKTANLPILSNILGMVYGGDSPFQASVYFINRAGTQTLSFRLPWFEVAESQPNLGTFTVPCSVQGTVYFAIDDYRAFIKLNRLTDFDTERLREKMMPILQSRIKGVVTNIGSAFNIPLVQLERSIDTVREEANKRLNQMFQEMFGTTVRSVEISTIEFNKDSEGYRLLKSITTDQVAKVENAKGDAQAQNFRDMQAINADNVAETARLQREQAFIAAHALDQQASVLRAAAQSLGQSGAVGGIGGGGGFNPAGVMMGIGLGGVMAGQMGSMLAGLGTPNMPGAPGMPVAPGGAAPPPPPSIPGAHGAPGASPPPVQYFMSAGGSQHGPYNMEAMRSYVLGGQLTAAHLVWRDGLLAWTAAGQLPDLMPLFGAPPPLPTPGPPPLPPTAPPTPDSKPGQS